MIIYHRNGTVITDQYDSVVAAVAAGADLTDANLSGADLSGADLSGAVVRVGNRVITAM